MTKEQHHDPSSKNTIIFLVFMLMLVSIATGFILFGIGLFWWKAYQRWPRARFYLVSGGLFVLTILAITFFTTTNFEAVRESSFQALYHFFSSIHLPGRLPVKFARFVIKTAAIGMMMGIGLPIYALKRKNRGLGKRDFKLKKTTAMPEQFKEERSNGKDFFIGFDEKNKPVFLTQNEMGMHTQIIGSTGFGKTASALIPNLNWALSRGAGMVFIDGKGDEQSFKQFFELVKRNNRLDDLQIFSTTFVDQSMRWNPLLRGRPVEIKDRLVGAQIWSEVFFKKEAEELLLFLLNVFDDLKITPTFQRLVDVLVNPDAFFSETQKINNPKLRERCIRVKSNWKQDKKNYAGLEADLNLFNDVDFSHLFDCQEGEGIDLLKAYKQNKVVYFHIPVLSLEETGKRIGRIIIHDLKTVVATIQTFMPMEQRRFFPVFIDEFSSFASENFIELLNKSRSAGVAFTLVHQSMGDVQRISDNFASQLFENTNVKIVMRIDEPETVEKYTRTPGTKISLKYTYQTERDLLGLGHMLSGGASMREVDEFLVDPNEFRGLSIGQAVVIVKSTHKIHRVNLDHINPPNTDDFKKFLLKKNNQTKSKQKEKNTNQDVPKFVVQELVDSPTSNETR